MHRKVKWLDQRQRKNREQNQGLLSPDLVLSPIGNTDYNMRKENEDSMLKFNYTKKSKFKENCFYICGWKHLPAHPTGCLPGRYQRSQPKTPLPPGYGLLQSHSAQSLELQPWQLDPWSGNKYKLLIRPDAELIPAQFQLKMTRDKRIGLHPLPRPILQNNTSYSTWKNLQKKSKNAR